MLFTTTTQYAALAIALIAGWLFGLASHPGGRKWQQRYADEREVHSASRRDLDARLAEANARIKELEAENARLGRAAPVTAATIAPNARTATVDDVRARPATANDVRARPATVAEPAYPARTGAGRGWFDWRNRDADRRQP